MFNPKVSPFHIGTLPQSINITALGIGAKSSVKNYVDEKGLVGTVIAAPSEVSLDCLSRLK